MSNDRSMLRVLGPVLGAILLFFVANAAIQGFRRDLADVENVMPSLSARVEGDEAQNDDAAINAEDGAESPNAEAVTLETTLVTTATETSEVEQEGGSVEADQPSESETAEEVAAEDATLATEEQAAPVEESNITEAGATDTAAAEANNGEAEPVADSTTEEQPADEQPVAESAEAPSAANVEEPEPAPTAEPDPQVADEADNATIPVEDADLAFVFSKGACAGCHMIPGIRGAIGIIGPDLTNIGVDAATRIDGYSAAEYIHESIVAPAAFIAPDCPTGACPEGVMLPSFAEGLTEAEVEMMVNYLLALGTNNN